MYFRFRAEWLFLAAFFVAGCNQTAVAPEPKSSVASPDATLFEPSKSVWVVSAANKVAGYGKFEPERVVLSPQNCAGKGLCRLEKAIGFRRAADGIKRQTNVGNQTDGTSVPKFLQAITGPKFRTDFLAAAIVHDHFCIRHVDTAFTTHQIYYEMLLTLGIEQKLALTMFAGVLIGGPKWFTLDKPIDCPEDRLCVRATGKNGKNEWRTKLANGQNIRLQDNGRLVYRDTQNDADRQQIFNQISRMISTGALKANLPAVIDAVLSRMADDPFLQIERSRQKNVTFAELDNWSAKSR